MNTRESYVPGPAHGAQARREGDKWTLMVFRELRHPPAKVWKALTDPAELREWAPFDADRNLGSAGPATLTTVGSPVPHVTVGKVKRAEEPRLLEFTWGGNDMRWELEPLAKGTRLTLWHNIGRKYIAMGAAGWHICLDVLDGYLEGHPIGRTVGPDALKVEGWQRLHGEYIKQFAADVEPNGEG